MTFETLLIYAKNYLNSHIENLDKWDEQEPELYLDENFIQPFKEDLKRINIILKNYETFKVLTEQVNNSIGFMGCEDDGERVIFGALNFMKHHCPADFESLQKHFEAKEDKLHE